VVLIDKQHAHSRHGPFLPYQIPVDPAAPAKPEKVLYNGFPA
jgi:hypothetical protein